LFFSEAANCSNKQNFSPEAQQQTEKSDSHFFVIDSETKNVTQKFYGFLWCSQKNLAFYGFLWLFMVFTKKSGFLWLLFMVMAFLAGGAGGNGTQAVAAVGAAAAGNTATTTTSAAAAATGCGSSINGGCGSNSSERPIRGAPLGTVYAAWSGYYDRGLCSSLLRPNPTATAAQQCDTTTAKAQHTRSTNSERFQAQRRQPS
jgi:hypothetical protein